MKSKKVLAILTTIMVVTITSMGVLAANASWNYSNYQNGSYVPKTGNMNSSYSYAHPQAYTNVTFTLDSTNVNNIKAYNNGTNSTYQGKVAYLTVDVTSLRDGSTDKMGAYTMASNLPDPKYDLENDDIFGTVNEESEVVALGTVTAQNYYAITGWDDMRTGASTDSGKWQCQFSMSQKGWIDYNTLTQSSAIQATINYGDNLGQD